MSKAFWRNALVGLIFSVFLLFPSIGAAHQLLQEFSLVSGGSMFEGGEFTMYNGDSYAIITDMTAHLDDCSGIDDANIYILQKLPIDDYAEISRFTPGGYNVPINLIAVGSPPSGSSSVSLDGYSQWTEKMYVEFKTAWNSSCDNSNSSAQGSFKVFGLFSTGRSIEVPYYETVTRSTQYTTLLPVDLAVKQGQTYRIHLELTGHAAMEISPNSNNMPRVVYDVTYGDSGLSKTELFRDSHDAYTNGDGVVNVDAYYTAPKDTVFHIIPMGNEGYGIGCNGYAFPENGSVADEYYKYSIICTNCDQIVVNPTTGNPDGSVLRDEISDGFQGPGIEAELVNSSSQTATVGSLAFFVTAMAPVEDYRLYMDVDCDGLNLTYSDNISYSSSALIFGGLNKLLASGQSMCVSLAYKLASGNNCGCGWIEATMHFNDVGAVFGESNAVIVGSDVTGRVEIEPLPIVPATSLLLTGAPGETVPVGVELDTDIGSCYSQMSAAFEICDTPEGGENAAFENGQTLAVVDFSSGNEASVGLVLPADVHGDYKICVTVIADSDANTLVCPEDPDGALEITVRAVVNTCEGQNDGIACDDGNPCTGDDACNNELCVGTAVVCSAQDDCHEAGICDVFTGDCSNPTKQDGSGCDDGNPCTLNDACDSGVCVSTGEVDCGDVPVCMQNYACNPNTGNCEGDELPDGTECEDESLCSTYSSCRDGLCAAGEYVICTPPNDCYTTGACQEESGECSPPEPLEDGTACEQDDGQSGVCQCQKWDDNNEVCLETECVPGGADGDVVSDGDAADGDAADGDESDGDTDGETGSFSSEGGGGSCGSTGSGGMLLIFGLLMCVFLRRWREI